MNIDLIKGICPIVAAPFANDESVDYDSLRNLVATLAKGGCHALTLFGIAGEYYKLDDAEPRCTLSDILVCENLVLEIETVEETCDVEHNLADCIRCFEIGRAHV